MNEQEPDTLERFGASSQEFAVDAGKKLAEGYILLANFIKNQYDQSQRGQRRAEKDKLDEALKEGGFEVNKDNREKLKAWSDAYEKNNEIQHEIGREISDLDKQIGKLETIAKLSPEEQQKRGYGQGEGLKDPTKEIDGLLSKKLDLGEKLDGMVSEAQMLEKGKGLEVLQPDQSMSLKEHIKEFVIDVAGPNEETMAQMKVDVDSEIKDLGKAKNNLQNPKAKAMFGLDDEAVGMKTEQIDQRLDALNERRALLNPQKEVRPGSVFDSLVKSGYMEKGGLSFMNDKSVGLQNDQNKQNLSSKPKLK
jgi:hypothetical protein